MLNIFTEMDLAIANLESHLRITNGLGMSDIGPECRNFVARIHVDSKGIFTYKLS